MTRSMWTYSTAGPHALPSFVLSIQFVSPLGRHLLRSACNQTAQAYSPCPNLSLCNTPRLLTMFHFKEIDKCWGERLIIGDCLYLESLGSTDRRCLLYPRQTRISLSGQWRTATRRRLRAMSRYEGVFGVFKRWKSR